MQSEHSINVSATLEAQGLCKTYKAPGGDLHILRDIHFAPPPGKLSAIIGASGIGKSTLLHILGTLERPTRGTVLIGGKDAFQLSSQELARFRNRSIGFVFQFHHLLPELDALENVMLPGWMAGREGYELTKEATTLLEAVGLKQRLQHRPRELSGGEQQRVAVARALVNNPVILLADEPTGNLDVQAGEDLQKLLGAMVKDRGQTTLVATHNERLAGQADAVYRMGDDGLHQVG